MKSVFSLSLLLQLLGLGQNRLWMVGRIVFANRLIDGFIKTDAPDGRPGQIRPSTRRCEPLPKNICETQLVFHETQDQTCCINGGRKDLKNIRWHLDEGGGGSNLNPRLRLFSGVGGGDGSNDQSPKWNNLQILTFGGNLRGRERC